MPTNPHSLPNPADKADEQARCFALKLKGHSVRGIATIVGLPKSTVQERLQAAYDDLVHPAAEEMRGIEVERYEKWLLDLETKQSALGVAITLDELCKLTATKTRVAERLARLKGLDAPVAVEQSGRLTVTIEGVAVEDLT